MGTFGSRFGQLVRIHRGIEGLTQEQLAHLAFGDVSKKSRISDLETGKISSPQQATIDALVVALQLTQDQLRDCRSPSEVELPRAILESLVQRFGHKNPDASVSELEAYLKAKSREFNDLKIHNEKLLLEDSRLSATLESAKEALASADFQAADRWYEHADQLQAQASKAAIERQAEIRWQRFRLALLQEDTLAAAAHAKSASETIKPIERHWATNMLMIAAQELHSYGQRFGGSGSMQAIEMWRAVLNGEEEDFHEKQAELAINNLGSACTSQGKLVGGPTGRRLLKEGESLLVGLLEHLSPSRDLFIWCAVHATLSENVREQAHLELPPVNVNYVIRSIEYGRVALEFLAKDDDPELWGVTQNNLALSYLSLAECKETESDMIAALETALKKHSEAASAFDPSNNAEHWATTKNNLGITARRLGDLSTGTSKEQYLEMAVEAYSDALTVRRFEKAPVAWAQTENNKAVALISLGRLAPSAKGKRALTEATRILKEVRKVFQRTDFPTQWLEAKVNESFALEALGDISASGKAPKYKRAKMIVDDALNEFRFEDGPAHYMAAVAQSKNLDEKLSPSE